MVLKAGVWEALGDVGGGNRNSPYSNLRYDIFIWALSSLIAHTHIIQASITARFSKKKPLWLLWNRFLTEEGNRKSRKTYFLVESGQCHSVSEAFQTTGRLQRSLLLQQAHSFGLKKRVKMHCCFVVLLKINK